MRKMGTDIGRRFEELITPHADSFVVVEDSPVLFNGMYRKIVLRKI